MNRAMVRARVWGMIGPGFYWVRRIHYRVRVALANLIAPTGLRVQDARWVTYAGALMDDLVKFAKASGNLGYRTHARKRVIGNAAAGLAALVVAQERARFYLPGTEPGTAQGDRLVRKITHDIATGSKIETALKFGTRSIRRIRRGTAA